MTKLTRGILAVTYALTSLWISFYIGDVINFDLNIAKWWQFPFFITNCIFIIIPTFYILIAKE